MSGYIGTQPVPQATQVRDIFTATSGQTVFNTAGYTVGYLDAYLNGVHLVPNTDYTANDGSTITLISGATIGDTLEVVAFSAFESASGGGGATGGGSNEVFYENDTNVTVDYTITSGKNAMSAGPITVDTGVTVTVPTGSEWTVV